MFVEHVPGSHVVGKRNDNFYLEGRPYLDGYKSIVAPKLAVRVNAIRSDQAAIEFRGFPPEQRDNLVNALGDEIVVQESDWNCVLVFTPNTKRKPFDDVRVRQALTLAVDRWGASQYLSKIAIVKTVGGVVFPKHPLAANEEELEQLIGYSKDIEASRAKARALLKEAGAEGIKVDVNNRDVDQPYKVVGTWLIDQWKKIGLQAKQTVRPSPQFYDTLRKNKEFDVSIDFNCQSVINPIADVTKFLCPPTSGNNYSQCENAELDEIYSKLAREGDAAKQRELMREFETKALEFGHTSITLWWYKINPHRTYVKGWKIAPSHYLAQQLDHIWLDR